MTAKRSSFIGYRLTLEQRESLERLSQLTGLALSELSRGAIVALIAHCEKRGVRRLLPVDFDAIFKQKKKSKK